jgi:hypothetical protein
LAPAEREQGIALALRGLAFRISFYLVFISCLSPVRVRASLVKETVYAQPDGEPGRRNDRMRNHR